MEGISHTLLNYSAALIKYR